MLSQWNKCLKPNYSICKAKLNWKVSGGACPQSPLVCSTSGGPTFLSVRTPSKPHATPPLVF